jgi:hypothetical protein
MLEQSMASEQDAWSGWMGWCRTLRVTSFTHAIPDAFQTIVDKITLPINSDNANVFASPFENGNSNG